MNIAFVSEHCCIRVVKEGLALIQQGHHVQFLHRHIANNDVQYVLPSMSLWKDVGQLEAKISMLDNIDIIHVHNTPDWLVSVCKAAQPDLPVVYDVHDMDSVRFQQPVGRDELEAFSLADGYVFPSEAYRRLAQEAYGQHKNDKANAIIYSRVLKDMIPRQEFPRLGGLVYQGGLSHMDADPYCSWIDYGFFVQACTASGIPVHLYSTTALREHYMRLGAIFHSALDYNLLLPELSRYDWGVVGCLPCEHPQQMAAMPNKLFEYIAAGIPILCLGRGEAADFVEKENLGLVITQLGQLSEVYPLHAKYRAIVQIKRQNYCMENQVSALEQLYQRVLDENRRA